MASKINFISIDATYPVAGKDNDSQGFRDNFTVIKNNFESARDEIEDLQFNTARLDENNDFNGNNLTNFKVVNFTEEVYDGGIIDSDTIIEWTNGPFQYFIVNDNLQFTLRSFPQTNGLARIRVQLLGDGVSRAITFAIDNELSTALKKSIRVPTNITIVSATDPQIFEFWTYDSGNTVFMDYLGNYDTIASGNTSSYILPKASSTVLGGIKVGEGLSIDASGVLRANITTISNFTTDNLPQGNINKYLTLNSLRDYLNDLTTDDLPEGTVNKYLTEAAVKYYINTLSSSILNDTNYDSVEVTGFPNSTTASTDTINLNTTDINQFRVGQKIRIFGASATDGPLANVPIINSVTKNGPATGGCTFSYKIVQFDYNTGKMSGSSAAANVSNIDETAFNIDNNITLSILREVSTYGILVYRKITGSISVPDYQLIAVLGPKDLGNSVISSFVDFFNTDLTVWSGKSIDRNEFTTDTGIVYFPIIAPATGKKGWVDATISQVVAAGTYKLSNSYFFDSSIIAISDDTEIIQTAIADAVSHDRNSLTLGERTYSIKNLLIPNNFTIVGKNKSSILKRLPWASLNLLTNSMLRTVNGNAGDSIYLENLIVDGNMQNQYLVDDEINIYNNYAINIAGTNISFNNIIVKNVIGGGIASATPNSLTVNLCQIEDSGMSDRYEYSPLVADSGTQVSVTNNVMRNFTSAVDLSLTDTGIINANIVENCGSGILVYGSLKLVSSPNLIVGPAGEFIPGPDIYNSEYDAINISLEPDTTFLSDSYVYQENGSLFNLTANRAEITYKLNKLRKVNNVEELYGEVLINGVCPLSGITNTNLANGEFRFTVSIPNVNTLTSTYSYSTLKAIEPNHVGLVYRVLCTEYVPAGAITNQVLLITATPDQSFYTVTVPNATNLAVGARVRLLGHGGTPNLNNIVGTITEINTISNQYTIEYAADITVAGTGGTITVENTFVLAKGRII